MYSASGASVCNLCAAGLTGPEGVPCTPCVKGTWRTVDTAACVACSANETTVLEASTSENACVCKPGFELASDSHCVQCPAGKFKSTEADSVCVNCPDYSTSAAGAVNITDCECAKGTTYPFQYDSCSWCPFGKYKDVVGSSACSDCPQYSYGTPGIPDSIDFCIFSARERHADDKRNLQKVSCQHILYRKQLDQTVLAMPPVFHRPRRL